jgi:energy-coupling factor transporter transmembrane protein EcfT
MRFALALLSLVTSFISSGLALLAVAPILRSLPLGAEYFSATPIHGLTYGELLAFIAIFLTSAFSIGLVHGLAYGKSCSRFVFVAALIPVITAWLSFTAVTMGIGLLALPVVLAYGIAVRRGARRGEGVHGKYCFRGGWQGV